MKLKCEHKWEIVGNYYNPPVRGITSFKAGPGKDSDLAMKALIGFTTITEKCSECGKTEVQAIFGQVQL